MVQMIAQTDKENIKMYMKCSKKELAKMLVERDKHIVLPQVVWVEPKYIEWLYPTHPIYPQPYQPDWYDPITTCGTAKMTDVQFTYTN